MDLKKYNCFVATTRGVMIYDVGKQKEIKFEKAEQPSEVTAFSFGKDEEILLGYENGNVSMFDPEKNKYVKQINDLEGDGRIVGLNYLGKTILASRYDGIINMWRSKKKNYFDIGLDEKGTLETVILNTFRSNIIGTGGEQNDFKLWDLETHQCVFKAKSQGHDTLNLPIPTSVRSIAFLPENEHLSVCCTKEGQLLLYDDQVQRRPVVKFSEKKASYTTVSVTHRERQVLVGTTRGYMQLVDMRNAKCLKTFTSFTGSVTGIHCDPFEPYVFTTCLDRFFRVHHLETKVLLHKIYLKQNLTKILVRAAIKQENEENIEIKNENEEKMGIEADAKEVDEEYEDIFKNMEKVEEVPKRKRKDIEDEKKRRKKKKGRTSELMSES